MSSVFSRKDMHLLSTGERLSLLWRIPLLVIGEIIFYVLEKYDPEWVDPLDKRWRMDG